MSVVQQLQQEPQKAGNTISVSDGDIYELVSALYVHQDNLSWNRIQTIVAIEGGILAGLLSQEGWFGPAFVAGGSALIWLIWRLVLRDWELRDHNLRLLEDGHSRLGAAIEVPARPRWARGRYILPMVVWGILCINVIVGVISTWPLVHSETDRKPGPIESTDLLYE